MPEEITPGKRAREIVDWLLRLPPRLRLEVEMLWTTDRRTFIGKYLYELNEVAGAGTFRVRVRALRDQEIERLRFEEEKTEGQIAQELGMTTDAVKKALKRARRRREKHQGGGDG
jgi:hypothetical protein